MVRHPIDTRLKTRRKANVRRSWRSGCYHRHPSYHQLFAKLLSRVNESDEEDDNVDHEDDDVFEEEESCKTNVIDRRSDSCAIYRRLLSLVSLRKIWNFLVRFFCTSHRDDSRTKAVTPSGKVVEIEDIPSPCNDWNVLNSDSDSEDLFQDCEPDRSNGTEDVTFSFSPPAPGFVEALNRPFSSLFLRHEVIFTPQPATPLVFTPATAGSSAQSNTSDRSRLADLCWDNYELATVSTDDGNVMVRERWSVLPRSQRMPLASCLKMLWNLDSPSYDQLAGSPIAEDVEENDVATNYLPAEGSSQHSVPSSESPPNYQQPKSSEGFGELLEDKSSGTLQLKDCNDNVLN